MFVCILLFVILEECRSYRRHVSSRKAPDDTDVAMHTCGPYTFVPLCEYLCSYKRETCMSISVGALATRQEQEELPLIMFMLSHERGRR